MRKDLEKYMDNREKRIAFAFMALDAKMDRMEKLRERVKQSKIKNPLLFYICLTGFIFLMAFLMFFANR